MPVLDPCKRGRLTTVDPGRTSMARRSCLLRVARLAERRETRSARPTWCQSPAGANWLWLCRRSAPSWFWDWWLPGRLISSS